MSQEDVETLRAAYEAFLMRSRPKGSSAVVEIRAGRLWTMRQGKAARLEIFPERAKALKAAGLG
jgi:hypothetical protein